MDLFNCFQKQLKIKFICAIKAAPFYSIILYTTQDISKVDQLSEIYHYCSIEKMKIANQKLFVLTNSS
jgi:2-polyprenyl-3-methyl-5-hydroxy-6-metoxy-1,4-benzoquinol methylase